MSLDSEVTDAVQWDLLFTSQFLYYALRLMSMRFENNLSDTIVNKLH